MNKIQPLYRYLKGRLNHFAKSFWKGVVLYINKKGPLVAGGLTFFVILSAFPLILIVISSLSSLLDQVVQVEEEVFFYINQVFPDLDENIKVSLTKLINSQINREESLGIKNWLFLIIAAMGGFSSTFQAIELISGQQAPKAWKVKLKSVFVLFITIVSVLVLLVITPVGLFLADLLRSGILQEYLVRLADLFPQVDFLEKLITGVFLRQLIEYVVYSNLLHGVVLLLYFSWVYRHLFFRNVRWRDGLLGAFVFMGLFLVGKGLFWYYLSFTREGYQTRYGDFSTLILAIFWIYLLINSFLLSSCVCLTSSRLKKGKNF